MSSSTVNAVKHNFAFVFCKHIAVLLGTFVNMVTSGSSVGSNKSTVSTMTRANWCGKTLVLTLLSVEIE